MLSPPPPPKWRITFSACRISLYLYCCLHNKTNQWNWSKRVVAEIVLQSKGLTLMGDEDFDKQLYQKKKKKSSQCGKRGKVEQLCHNWLSNTYYMVTVYSSLVSMKVWLASKCVQSIEFKEHPCKYYFCNHSIIFSYILAIIYFLFFGFLRNWRTMLIF